MLVLIAAALTAGTAHAQRAPDMATLDRGDGISKVGVDVGLTFIDDAPYSLALRLEVYGQYVTKSGFGIYGSLPLSSSFGAPDDDEDPVPPDLIANDATALGNVEVGGLYVITKSPRLSFVFRGGLGLPTASEGRDEAATLFSAVFPRLTDLANAIDAWYLRLGFSPLIYADKLFFRADIGFDIGIDGNGFDPNSMLRFNLGAGVDLGPVALGLELVNTVIFLDEDEDFLNTLALTVRFMGRKLQPYIAVGAPLDDTRDSVSLFLAGGIQFVP